MAKLETELEQLKVTGGEMSDADRERNEQIERQYEADRARLQKMRLAIVSVYVYQTTQREKQAIVTLYQTTLDVTRVYIILYHTSRD